MKLTNSQDIMVVETDWPAICTSGSVDLSENYPISEAGQTQWVSIRPSVPLSKIY